MMTLENFESYVPYKILQRGMEYFEEGRVYGQEETDDGEWHAEVEGTETYEVEVLLCDNDVVSTYCDCPFDGDICKHVVAVLLAIREELEKIKNSAFYRKKNHPIIRKMKEEAENVDFEEEDEDDERMDNKDEKLSVLLDKLEPEQIKSFMEKYAKMHPKFITELSEFIEKQSLDSTRNYWSELTEIFMTSERVYRSRYDHYGSHDWFVILYKTEALFDDLEKELEKGDYETVLDVAVHFLELFDEEFDDGLLYGEYDMGHLCDRAGQMILQTIGDYRVSDKKQQQKITVLKQLAEHSVAGDYDYIDFKSLFVQATVKTESEENAIKMLDEQIAASVKDYDKLQYVEMKLDLLRDLGKDEDVVKTIQQFIHLPEIRKHVVDGLIMSNQYDEALRLINEGIVIANKMKHPGTAKSWEEKKLEVYEWQGNKDKQRDQCRLLFISYQGSRDYYHKLKKLVPIDEWKSFLNQMIDEAKISPDSFSVSTLADIYVEERDGERLYNLLASMRGSRLNMLDEYAYRIKGSHSQPLLALYAREIQSYAAGNTGRNHYERIGKSLICMQKLNGGKTATKQLAAELLQKYRNRPAMREILSKFV